LNHLGEWADVRAGENEWFGVRIRTENISGGS